MEKYLIKFVKRDVSGSISEIRKLITTINEKE